METSDKNFAKFAKKIITEYTKAKESSNTRIRFEFGTQHISIYFTEIAGFAIVKNITLFIFEDLKTNRKKFNEAISIIKGETNNAIL